MDFKYGDDVGPAGDKAITAGESLYGDRLGQQIRDGLRVDGNEHAEKGFYSLTSGYGNSRVATQGAAAEFKLLTAPIKLSELSSSDKAKYVRWDPDVVAEADKSYAANAYALVFRAPLTTAALGNYIDLVAEQDLTSLTVISGTAGDFVATTPNTQSVTPGPVSNGSIAATPLSGTLVRRLTRIVQGQGVEVSSGVDASTATPTKYLELVYLCGTGGAAPTGSIGTTVAVGNSLAAVAGIGTLAIQFAAKDKLQGVVDPAIGTALGALQATTPWTLENSSDLKEIQLKVDSFAITARTRKLKAAWTPELGQDLNAYHNLDAEVELTSILSEQIGLEIDQEILNDLIKGATGGVKYWSRRPGKFVDRVTGADLGAKLGYANPPDFTGNISMWYETLLETVNDVSALIHRKTLRGGANFMVVSPEVANILEFTAGFRATVTHDAEKGSTGAVKVGALNSKFDVIVDPYFPRNVILIGRKGSSFLESGYVYAPYVPLQTSPTIFDPGNFTPRKAVMTRYGKAFVRPDMYGIVVVQDLNG
jgi:hypothetical protein